MERTPEPELMDDLAQARAYAEEDFSEANSLFMEQFGKLYPQPVTGRALDLGCGPADITLRFARAYPGCHIDGIDGAEAMLNFGRQALEQEAGLQQRVTLICERLPAPSLTPGQYQHIISNSLLHHLHDPSLLWQTVTGCARPGASILIMDLLRPDTRSQVDALVERYAESAPDLLKRDFRNSLLAAFTPEEVAQQLRGAGLENLAVTRVSDRHMTISGYLQGPRSGDPFQLNN